VSDKNDERMKVTSRSQGYHHVVIVGECDADVTVEDVRRRFYHPQFGGRDAWVTGGRFGCTVHTD